MILESLTGDQINIGNLNLTEPQHGQEVQFDPEKEITDAEWLRMESALEGYTNNMTASILGLAKSMKILSPERDFPYPQKKWTSLENFLNLQIDNYMQGSFSLSLLIGYLADAKIIYQGTNRQQEVAQICGRVLQNALDFSNKDPDPSHAPYLIVDMKILAPTSYSPNLKDLEGLKDYARDEDGLLLGSESEGLAENRLIFPGYKPVVSNKEWKEFRKYLRNQSIYYFAQTAASLKILAAEEVKITENGIELIMPTYKPSFTEPIPALPETRKF